jgi:hypothetical protein
MHDLVRQTWETFWSARFSPGVARIRFGFGLGREISETDLVQIPRFLHSLRCASTIADSVFPSGCIGIVAGFRPTLPNGTLGQTNVFKDLNGLGFAAPQLSQWEAELYPDEEPEDKTFWDIRSYDLKSDNSDRDILLWCSAGADLGIRPIAFVQTFLIDPSRQIMMHLYDDRGMDLTASNPETLRATYEAYDAWLLEYDRERMALLF